MTKRHPWDRRPDETPRAYEVFRAYLKLGRKRSIVAAAVEIYGPERGRKKAKWEPPSHVRAWSSRFEWVARAAAYDKHQDDKDWKVFQAERKRVNIQRARELREFQQAALEKLRAIDPEEMSPKDALDFYERTLKLERTIRGEPEAITEQRSKAAEQIDPQDLTDEQFDALLEAEEAYERAVRQALAGPEGSSGREEA